MNGQHGDSSDALQQHQGTTKRKSESGKQAAGTVDCYVCGEAIPKTRLPDHLREECDET